MKIEVRPAIKGDWSWIRKLAMDSAVHTLPPTRKVSVPALQARVQASLRELASDSDCKVLIAWEPSTNTRLGYLILMLNQVDDASGEPQCAIHDLAVEANFRGTPAVRHLVQAATKLSAEHGFQYLVGEVTAENRRAYLKALRLGFQLERYRIVMPCQSGEP
jgi:ribosomal protein S18 acetylase RimI-like enzyme